MRTIPLLFSSVVLLLAAPLTAAAQADDQTPPNRFVEITSFRVPIGEDRQKVLMWVDSVMVPAARLNPNVLSYRVAIHNYGSNAGDILIISEYADWASITAPCGQPCQDYFEERQPEEGSERDMMYDELQTLFLKYYGTHRDEIYLANGRRIK